MSDDSEFFVHIGNNYYNNLLHLREKIKNSEDHLKFILYYTKLPWSSKIIRFLAITTLLYHSCNVLIFIYRSLTAFNKDIALRYASGVGFSIFIMANIGNIIFTGDDVINFAVKYQNKLLPLEFASNINYRKIMLTKMILKIVIFCNFIIAYTAAILVFNHDRFNNKKFYIVEFIRKLFPYYSAELLVFYFRFSHLVSGHMTIVGAYILSYVGFHTSFQLKILKEFVEHICDRKCHENQQYYNKMNQKSIAQKLKICSMFHAFLDKSIQNLNRINYNATLLYSGGVIFLGGGIMVEVLSVSDPHQEQQESSSNMGFFLVTVAGILTTGLYASVGQMMKNESEELHKKLTIIPWYNMNHDNKVLLSLLMIQTKKEISFDIDLLQMDYLLLVRILRGLYSMSTIVTRMKK